MNTLESIVTTGEVAAIFCLCLGMSLGIAYVFLKTVVVFTTRMNGAPFKPAGLVSRRSLGSLFLRATHDPGS
jgi:hypothetical protein